MNARIWIMWWITLLNTRNIICFLPFPSTGRREAKKKTFIFTFWLPKLPQSKGSFCPGSAFVGARRQKRASRGATSPDLIPHPGDEPSHCGDLFPVALPQLPALWGLGTSGARSISASLPYGPCRKFFLLASWRLSCLWCPRPSGSSTSYGMSGKFIKEHFLLLLIKPKISLGCSCTAHFCSKQECSHEPNSLPSSYTWLHRSNT